MKRYTRARRGFTLIELILYIAIVGTILLSAVGFLSVILESRIQSQITAEVEQQGSFAVTTLADAIRNADGISTPAAGESDDTLEITAGGTNSVVSFSVENGTLMENEGGNKIALTNNRVSVSNFAIQNLAASGTPSAAHINLDVTYRNETGRSIFDFVKNFQSGATSRR